MSRCYGWPAVVTVTAVLLITPGAGWSWGPLGHRVSAELAERRLTPAARDAVRNLLGPGVSLPDIASWADLQQEVRESSQWHYVDVPLSQPRYNPAFCHAGGCVVSKIEYFRRLLIEGRGSRAERQQALKFLVHLIQDVHQPLHVGDNGSRGGNLLQVRFFDSGSNLHRVWDSEIIEKHSTDEARWLSELESTATPEKAATWSKGTVEDWATESLYDAKLAYLLPGNSNFITPGTNLGEKYFRFALPVVQLRLAQSGVRLAATLNAIFR